MPERVRRDAHRPSGAAKELTKSPRGGAHRVVGTISNVDGPRRKLPKLRGLSTASAGENGKAVGSDPTMKGQGRNEVCSRRRPGDVRPRERPARDSLELLSLSGDRLHERRGVLPVRRLGRRPGPPELAA